MTIRPLLRLTVLVAACASLLVLGACSSVPMPVGAPPAKGPQVLEPVFDTDQVINAPIGVPISVDISAPVSTSAHTNVTYGEVVAGVSIDPQLRTIYAEFQDTADYKFHRYWVTFHSGEAPLGTATNGFREVNELDADLILAEAADKAAFDAVQIPATGVPQLYLFNHVRSNGTEPYLMDYDVMPDWAALGNPGLVSMRIMVERAGDVTSPEDQKLRSIVIFRIKRP